MKLFHLKINLQINKKKLRNNTISPKCGALNLKIIKNIGGTFIYRNKDPQTIWIGNLLTSRRIGRY